MEIDYIINDMYDKVNSSLLLLNINHILNDDLLDDTVSEKK